MFKKIRGFAKKHKIFSVVVILVVVGSAYALVRRITGNSGPTLSVLSPARLETIEATVSGSGQVSSSNQVDVKAKASGTALSVLAVAGRYVAAGGVLATLDAHDAAKSVRDADIALQNAKISLEKFRGPDGSAVPRNKEQAATDLAQAYDDGFSTVANAFIDLPSLLTNYKNLLQDKTLDKNQDNLSWYANQIDSSKEIDRAHATTLRDATQNAYDSAQAAYNANFDSYKQTARNSPREDITALIKQTYDTVKLMADAVKDMSNYIDFVRAYMEGNNFYIPAAVATEQTSLNSSTGTLNGHLTKLLSAVNSLKNANDAYANADLDLAAQELSYQQKVNSLADVKEKLDDYTVRAPWGGVVAKVNVHKGDEVSSGTVVAIIETTQKIAEISFNEVDAARLVVGQTASLTFDALPDITASGTVSEIDAVGTVSQGVVSYGVKITFNSPDTRIKSGMSVTAAIVTDHAENTLVIPNAAIKTAGARTYVEVVSASSTPAIANMSPRALAQGIALATAPARVFVTVGITNDTAAQILSGLNAGDLIVVRTITGTQAAAPAAGAASSGNRGSATQNNASFRIPGLGGGGVGGARTFSR